MRAVAIGLVLLFHFMLVRSGSPIVRAAQHVSGGGWIGVDLFFVLSGFLITGICLDHQGPGFLRAFYARRALRILPAYFLIVGVITAVSLSVLGRLPAGFIWLSTFSTNVAIAHAGTQGVVPLSAAHLWSVAVEEQFYLVWPLCIVALPRRAALALAVAAIPIAALARAWFMFVAHAPLAAQELTISRMDALAAGAILAFLARTPLWTSLLKRARRVAIVTPLVAWILLAAVACVAAAWPAMSVATTGARTVAVLRYSGLCLGGAVLVVVGVSARGLGPLSRALRTAGMQWLGRRSYGVYLIHLPVAKMLVPVIGPRTTLGLCMYIGVATTVTFALAELSWRMVERPALERKHWFQYPRSPFVSAQAVLNTSPHRGALSTNLASPTRQP